MAIYRHGLGFELGVTVKHIQVVVRAELKARISECQSDALTTWLPWPLCTHWVMVLFCLVVVAKKQDILSKTIHFKFNKFQL